MPAKALEVGALVKSGIKRRTLPREYSRKLGSSAKQEIENACALVKCTVTGSTANTVDLRVEYIRLMTNKTSGYRIADTSIQT